MIKRSESKQKKFRRQRSGRVAQKRRLKMEGLEKRQLLAVLTEPPTQPPPVLEEYEFARNIGTVQAFTSFESETIIETGENDTQAKADFLPLGTGPGQQDTIDITGSLPITTVPTGGSGFSSDLDTYAFNLRGGDILDVATLGAAGGFTVRANSGSILFGSDTAFGPNNGLTPFPVQDIGNATGTMVIPEDGRYTLTVSATPLNTGANYTLGLRVYRPTSEQLAIGDAPILYLDFAGGLVDNNIFNDVLIQANPGLPVGGVTRVRSLLDSLPILGLQFGDTVTANRIVDDVYSHTVRIFEDLARTGENGDYEATGTPGDFGIRILNSRDHRGQVALDDPRMTRLLIGGTGLDFGLTGVFGIAQSIDRGNFDLSEFGVFALDAFAQVAQTVPIAPNASQIDLVSKFLASVAAHEAGHTFGMWHTDNTDSIGTLSDAGGTQNANDYGQGIGNDLVFGTLDDIDPVFNDDFYHPPEGFFGVERITASFSHVLSTGTVGGSISGSVFSDANRDGRSTGDSGLGGVTLFADVNSNGILDHGEPSDISDGAGNFSISAGSGSVTVIAIQPEDHVATTPTSVTTSIGASGVSFGFNQVISNITGTVFSDNNGDGFLDTGEAGIEGVFVYIDVDNDNRPDLGESSTITAADGSYAFNFPHAGTFTIRQVLEPGFEQTSPAAGEHTVTFNGTSLGDNFNFGNRPSRDFGDAPDTYGTTLAAGGANHGITDGLRIGDLVDPEIDGQPDSTASGDDTTDLDDESGVRLLSPLGPDASATFEVTATNTTGVPAFLQAFMDFNRDGDFNDAGERFRTNVSVPSGTVDGVIPIEVTVPAGASIGTTFARFRLSQSSGLGPTGFAATGEVEDYSFPILDAAEVANDDTFTVSRNTLSNQLDVLGNDFQTADNELLIDSVNVTGTEGVVVRSADQKSLFYTPPNGFIGRDVLSYTVVDEFGNRSTAAVVVNVSFQSNIPIAIDDTFEVPEGSVNRALNVLDNDLPSIFGGLTITSVTGGSSGGTLAIIGGGQSLRYTPLPGFNGTEQFTYSVQDAVGTTSSAMVTVNLLPGSFADDVVDFRIDIFDPVNTSTPLTNVQVGQDILVRVTVNDIRLFPDGVTSAFLDLLYTDGLVATLDTDNNPDFPFDISFGPDFSNGNVLQRGSAQVPGLINEVGGVERISVTPEPYEGPQVLFTLTMRAVSPGVAVFAADPADDAISETITRGSDVALTPSQLRLGRTELLILPASDNFTSAIDDSFPDGRDSDGNLITNSSADRNRLDVLDNDNLGPTGTIREFGLVTGPSRGNVLIDDNGTPSNLNDDFFSYRANAGENGLEKFTYVIVTDDGITSTAEVTISLGNNNALAEVAIDFALVSGDGSGTPINSVRVGERFGIQVIGEDLRSFGSTSVFAGFLDVLYDTGVIQPSNINQGDQFDFDVLFPDSPIEEAYSGLVGAGTAARPGIIDEFGAVRRITSGNQNVNNPALMATLFFDAVNVGTTSIVGSPADSFPDHDTLLLSQDTPVDVSRIRYDSLQINVSAGAPLQNALLPQDVNNDGTVSAIDALLIINNMSRKANRLEGESRVASGNFLDVNGDEETTAIDALLVINYLSLRQQLLSFEAEGEAVAQQLPSTATDLSSDVSDDVFANLGEGEAAPVAAAMSNAQAGLGSVGVAADDGDDDDEEGVLDLLADDVVGRWS